MMPDDFIFDAKHAKPLTEKQKADLKQSLKMLEKNGFCSLTDPTLDMTLEEYYVQEKEDLQSCQCEIIDFHSNTMSLTEYEQKLRKQVL